MQCGPAGVARGNGAEAPRVATWARTSATAPAETGASTAGTMLGDAVRTSGGGVGQGSVSGERRRVGPNRRGQRRQYRGAGGKGSCNGGHYRVFSERCW